jgi:hypothetical protein
MPTRPGYVWDNTALEWVTIGPVALPGSTVFYQSSAPSSPATGDIWVDADDEVPGITSSLNYRWRKIATGGETSLSGNDTSGLPLAYNPGYEQVYLNGVLQYRGSDYVATTGNTITGLTALVANDTIEVLSFVTAPIGDTYTQAAADAKFVSKAVGGLTQIIPTSVTGGTVSTNGAVTIGSAVSAVTINGAFSSTYDNYKIVINGVGGNQNQGLIMKLGSTATGYYGNLSYALYTATGFTMVPMNNTAHWFIGLTDGTNPTLSTSFDLMQPFLSLRSQIMGNYYGRGYMGNFGASLENTTSYTSFNIANEVGTLTGGTIRIYGYNNGA